MTPDIIVSVLIALLVAGVGYYIFTRKKDLKKPTQADANRTQGVPTTPPPPKESYPPTPSAGTLPKALKLPAGVIGQPNADRLVQVQAAEDARAKYSDSTDPIMADWARNGLPRWWGFEEIALQYPETDVAAKYLLRQCNTKMLLGALNRNNDNMWALFVVPKGEATSYASLWDAGVVAGSNNLPSGLGFKGIKVADLADLIEKNRLMSLSGGGIPPRNNGVAPPVAGPGGGKRNRRDK